MSRVLDPTSSTEPATPFWEERFHSLDAVRSIMSALGGDTGSLHVHKLTGSAKALLAAEVRKQTGRPVLVIMASEDRAEALRTDLETILAEPVHLFAEHQTAPYDIKPPHTDVSADRLETLTTLATRKDGVVVATARALAEQVISPEVLREQVIRFEVGKAVDLDPLLERLTYLGYNREQAVEEVGDFALRGGILDIYSLGGENPIRIEVEYDEVASIREFDIHTQRSVHVLDDAMIIPRHELILDPERTQRAVAALSREDAEAGTELEEAFEEDVHPAGIERMASKLGQDLGPFHRYLPSKTVFLVEEPGLVHGQMEGLWEEVISAHQSVSEAFPHVSPPEDLYLSLPRLREASGAFFRIRLSDLSSDPGDGSLISVRSSPPDSFGRKIDLWRDYLQQLITRGHDVTIFCDNEGQRTRLSELLVDEGVPVRLVIGVLSAGFVLEEAKLAVLTDHEFFGRPRRTGRRRRFRSGFGLKELRSLKVGAYVVHVEHGIGRYLGLTRLEVNGHLTDVLKVEYHKGDKLYVPVDQLGLLQKYSSEEGKVTALSRLGGTGWSKTKDKAKKAIKEMAGELIRLYARRKANPGHPFEPDSPWQRELEGSFPFEETPDQVTAVGAVKSDMETPVPMDRLICGDVGYGKTEVAVRAAFKAIQSGKQVAMLVPTTILAEQHFNTFRERFGEFPISVDLLSRFRTPKERAQVLERLGDGRLDMVIGTHALLGKKVKFQNLGLLVVDEEQRFGVGHKEKIKQLRINVDVLTLTATPIPRTLNMSLLGVRDITVINTPPPGRMSVQTEIVEFDREIIQEALLREADRGGQSFFVHNRVNSIATMASYVQKLCPQLRIGIGHGQLPERALEKVMHDFIEKRLDVLVATMIIENGLDIPSVNTMIVNRADAFGLSQLYQLRGRVGRSTQKAYCHFMVPSGRVLTETAMKRLRAIAEFDELGSGFALAMRDLEIRGSGNILGAEQSGHVISVGFEMYCRLVDEAVRELKGMPLEDRPEPRLTTDIAAFLPDDYVADAEEKVGFYKRLADVDEPEGVDALREELEDRFGRLTPEASALFDLRRLRLLGALAGASSISFRNNKLDVDLAESPTPEVLRGWMRGISHPVEFATSGRFALLARAELGEAMEILTAMATDGQEDPDRGEEANSE